MNTLIALAVATLVKLAAHPALAQDKTPAIVVKGLDNPFFEQINLGCQKWNAENKGKGYTRLYTRPASSTDDTLAGAKGTKKLTGQNGWKEIDGCPVFTNDQADLANRQMADVFTANPKLDAFVLEGGWAQFAPQAYAQVTGQVMEKLKSKSLIIVAGDTLPPRSRR